VSELIRVEAVDAPALAGAPAVAPIDRATELGAVRAGAIVFIGVGVSNFCAYLFHLVSARSLGPASYSDVAVLAAVTGLLTLPLGGTQVFVARHVASSTVRGAQLDDDGYVSGFAGAMLVAGGFVALVLLLLSPLIRSALSIASLSAVVLAVLVTVPSFVAPSIVGAAQGCRRFTLVAVAIAAPAALRVILAAAGLQIGLGVSGTMAATLAAGLASVAIPLVVLRGNLIRLPAWRPRIDRSDVRALLPIVAGTLAITCLTTDDLVAAKVVYSGHEAGLYGSASLVGRVILYLPVAIVTVMLPIVSARASVSQSTVRIFTRSFLATAAFCLLATAVYAAAPHTIMQVVFGSKYVGSSSLLWMFGIAMTIYALLNVLLTYRIGHGETATCWLLLAGAGVQALAYIGLHSSPRQLLATSIATGAILLVASFVGPTSRSPLSLRDWLRTRDASPA
jgi:O-antigen/teichoic acid export membrane protein